MLNQRKSEPKLLEISSVSISLGCPSPSSTSQMAVASSRGNDPDTCMADDAGPQPPSCPLPQLISSSSNISLTIEEDDSIMPSPEEAEEAQIVARGTNEIGYTPTISTSSDTRKSLHPDLLAEYELRGELGQGGFGFVLEAVRRRDMKPVAVKFIIRSKIPSNSWARDDDLGVVPFEVFILKNIKHQCIIGYIDCLADDRYFYLITELHGAQWTASTHPIISDNRNSNKKPDTQLPTPPPELIPLLIPQITTLKVEEYDNNVTPGQQQLPAPLQRRVSCDLFECIEQYSYFTEEQSRYVFRQIASAVAHLHQLNIVHRDIKDENLLIDDNFNVKLIDFGSAAFIPAKSEPLFDRFLGTIQYAPPEILRGKRYRGPEAEIWSLGCCLYIMLNGEVPFESPQQVMTGMHLPFTRPVSDLCKDLVQRMLARHASDRPTIKHVVAHPWLSS
ncbi:hypothetical protein SeLEV6574_g03067 [Synchytrium endobioticum]|uniref:Protein kinase domain-containing protein n=1 Tax=Synchytrium endobioticum TaxID=286115 RepID=A0A507D5Z0_9FUNG|nr:hypothetical protein SeLEV6574_g03067 [Synchytrium endobioticum]